MDKFIDILKAILTGCFTGFVISIPLGPAGLESVKRTISDGYKEGFSVSIGALSADLAYLLLINGGLSNLLSKNRKTEALFWIFSGLILSSIGYLQIKAKSGIGGFKINFFSNSKAKSMPFLAGFLITFSNPMTPSLWLTLSGTVIRAWYYVGPVFYYTFIISIIAGMVTWFAVLNLLALKGFKILNPNVSKRTSIILQFSIFIIGITFVIFGIIKFII
ncbi:MAG: putative threonine efflux protein [Clostridiaceae bacterium]|jgi:threonine/homoserine/homoserine lactone efflux protein|nr:putative threonine efflux protein [Clostridiaceae bacterium]